MSITLIFLKNDDTFEIAFLLKYNVMQVHNIRYSAECPRLVNFRVN